MDNKKTGYFSKAAKQSLVVPKIELPKRDIFGAYFTVTPVRAELERPEEELEMLTKLDKVLISGDSTVRLSNLAISFDDINVIQAMKTAKEIPEERKWHFYAFIKKFQTQLNDEFDTVYFSEFEAALFYECLLWQKLRFTFVSTRD